MTSNKKKIVILILLALTLVLGFVSIFLATQTAKTPTDTPVVGICCGAGSCNNGETFGEDTTGSAFANCGARADAFCNEGRGGTANPGGDIECGTTTPTKKGQGEVCNGGDCQDGLVCTPDEGNTSVSRCNTPPVVGKCPGRCNRYITFKCDDLTNGKCEENPIYENNPSYAAGCGQIDQVCGAGENENQLCGDARVINTSCGQTTNPPNPPPTNPPPTNPPPTNPPSTPLTCGSVCTTNGVKGLCPTDHICSAGKCVLDDCLVTGATCTADKCAVTTTPPAASCGGSCTTEGVQGQCPNNHTCTAGKCVLNNCLATGASCSADKCSILVPQVTTCGGTCTTNANCPIDHQCSAGKCVLNSCVGNAACINNGCVLPTTAIVSDSVDRLMLGFMFVLIGILILKFDALTHLSNVPGYLLAPSKWVSTGLEERKKTKIRETKSKFEKQVEERISNK